MTDELAAKEQENEGITQPTPLDAHPDEIDHPVISGYFSIIVDTKDAASIGFSIVPKDDEYGFTSITAGFVRTRSGVLQDGIGTTNFTFNPSIPGLKVGGGTSEKIGAFPPLETDEKYMAILQGTLRQKTGKPQSFYINKQIQFQ